MAFENFPESEKSTPVPSAPVRGNGRNILTGALVVALLGTWGYIIWDKNQTKETIRQKDTVIATTSNQRDELQKELEDATMRYDMIKTSSANMMHTKDSVINKRDREISSKREQIRQLLAKVGATKEELAQAKTLIASLNGDIEDYKSEVEKLRGEKIVLTQEKANITKERDQVTRDFDSAKTVLKQKEDMINVASTLTASNFSILGIDEKGNGKEKETTTAKRVDKFRISFDIAENRIAESGSKVIFVCITGPDGKPILFGNEKFSTRENGDKFYTQKLVINYVQGQRQPVSFDWKLNGPFNIGDYRIEVYHNGFKIGEGTRTLKKGGIFG
ncbi:MAG: hypothetical protein IPI66_08600 [Chitinophagaceae bacterium]|nr:hypothetical protein [Chitinophagaceae bacterium]MBL0056966.1 hypothetical protein [Chitinophagaceae bacterium]